MAKKDQTQAELYPGGVDIANEYTFSPGVCILPLAEDPPTDPEALKAWSPVVKLQIHAPFRMRRQTTSAKKQNNPPVYPAPEDAGKFVFVGGTLSVGNSLNATNANFDWLVNTEYVFVENCVSRVEDGFVLGSPPYDTIIEQLNAAQFQLIPSQIPSGTGPEYGAVASAGTDAQVGWMMGQSAFGGPTSSYGYNCRSFLPGTFSDNGLSND